MSAFQTLTSSCLQSLPPMLLYKLHLPLLLNYLFMNKNSTSRMRAVHSGPHGADATRDPSRAHWLLGLSRFQYSFEKFSCDCHCHCVTVTVSLSVQVCLPACLPACLSLPLSLYPVSRLDEQRYRRWEGDFRHLGELSRLAVDRVPMPTSIKYVCNTSTQRGTHTL